LYTTRRSPVAPALDARPRPSVYWQIAGRGDVPRPPRGTGLERHVTSGGENDDVIGENGANDAEDVGDRDPRPNRSPDLVLNGRQQDQKLTGSSK